TRRTRASPRARRGSARTGARSCPAGAPGCASDRSSMARRAVGAGPDVVRTDEIRSERRLIVRLPRHVEHLVERPDVALRLAMAVEAPFHVQRLRLVELVHLVDAPVAGDAAHALRDVDLMVEVHEVRQIVDLDPLERRLRREALAHRLEIRAVAPDLRVAVHAGLRRWDVRHRGALDAGVAVPAVDAEL